MPNGTLDSFFGVKRKASDEPTNEQSVSKAVKSDSNGTPKKVRDAWRSEWNKSFPWIEKVQCDGQTKAICLWCKNSGKTNSMATTGSCNLQSSTFSRHESSRDHLMATEAHRAKQKRTAINQVVEDLTLKQVDSECDGVKEAQFNTLYYLAKEGQPLRQYKQVIDLQIKNKCPELQDTTKLYTSEEVKSEMLNAIYQTIEEQVDSDIDSSEFIGLIVDESTDVTIHKKLSVYVKCLNENKAMIHFMDCVSVHDGKAETIVSEIVQLFARKNIPMTKLMFLASDGAAVMTGRLNGVRARLKREQNPHMMQIHCVAHNLALAAGQACRDIQLFIDYQHTLKLVYRYFANSAVRYNELRAMVDILDDEDIEYVTLKEPASFRWLSLDGAVRAIAECYPALYATLEHDAVKGSSEAKGLFTRIKCVTFV